MKQEIFQAAGMTEHEGTVYMTLLQLRKGQVSDIVRASGLHRPAVYTVLASLQQKNLVAVTPEGKRNVYLPQSPQRIKDLFELRSRVFLDAITQLEAEFEQQTDTSRVRLFRGIQGMRSVLKEKMERLKKGALFYRYDAYDGKVDYKKFRPTNYDEVREKLDWQQFVITNTTLRNAAYKKRLNCASKVFPKEFDDFEYNIGETIYNDTVYFEDYDEQTTLVIQNARFAQFQKRIFEMLYKKLPG